MGPTQEQEVNMAQYESDLTKFMRGFLRQHPEEVASQAVGRGVW